MGAEITNSGLRGRGRGLLYGLAYFCCLLKAAVTYIHEQMGGTKDHHLKGETSSLGPRAPAGRDHG